MDQHIIVTERALREHRFKARMGVVGAVVSALSLLVLSFETGRMVAYQDALEDIQAVSDRQTETQRALVASWTQQTEAIALIETWGQYIKDRESLLAVNRGMPIQRPNWRKRP
jgi:hypothetical protein